MKSKSIVSILIVIVIGLAVGGFFYTQSENTHKEIVQSLKDHYGYPDSGYSFSLTSYKKDGPEQSAVVHVTYLPENLTWDIVCLKIGDSKWDRAPEQMRKDMSDIEDIGYCLKSLAGGVRIGRYVYNNKNEIDSCRDAIKLYNVRHPKSRMENIGN